MFFEILRESLLAWRRLEPSNVIYHILILGKNVSCYLEKTMLLVLFLTLTKRSQFFWCQHLNRKILQKLMSEIIHWFIARSTIFKSTIQEIPEGLISNWFLFKLWHNKKSKIVKGIWLSGQNNGSVQGFSLKQMAQKTFLGMMEMF